MTPLDELIAIERIRGLKARYFRLLDTRDWVGLVGVFTETITVDVEGNGGPRDTTAVAFVDRVAERLAGATTVHHGHTPEIHVASDTTATGTWAMEDEIWWPEGHEPSHLHGYGHYHERYEVVDGVWRIRSMQLTRLRAVVESKATPTRS